MNRDKWICTYLGYQWECRIDIDAEDDCYKAYHDVRPLGSDEWKMAPISPYDTSRETMEMWIRAGMPGVDGQIGRDYTGSSLRRECIERIIARNEADIMFAATMKAGVRPAVRAIDEDDPGTRDDPNFEEDRIRILRRDFTYGPALPFPIDVLALDRDEYHPAAILACWRASKGGS